MNDAVKPNARFMIDIAKGLPAVQADGDAKILDFGCGVGETVSQARSEGALMWGADTFDGYYKDWATRLPPEIAPYVEQIDGGLPFADGFFDGVISNQVFEHIEYPEASLKEIGRVLHTGGKFCFIFPDAGVIREGHVGLWMPHWLRKWQRAQRAYLTLCYSLGLGRKRQLGVDGWWRTLNEVTFYHKRDRFIALAEASVGGKAVDITQDFLKFRLRNSRAPIFSSLLRVPFLREVMVAVARRHAGLVIVIEKLEKN